MRKYVQCFIGFADKHRFVERNHYGLYLGDLACFEMDGKVSEASTMKNEMDLLIKF